MSAATYGCNTLCCRSGQPRSGVTFQIPQGAHYGPSLRHLQPAWPLGLSPFRKFEAPSRGLVVTHARRKWYAIFEPSPVRGVYRVWEQVQQLVSGQSNAVHKGFASEAAALEWISKLTLRAKEEDATLENLRRMIFGSNYRVGVGQPAALTSNSCLLASHASTNTGDSSGSVAMDAVSSTGTSGPSPRPWQTPPIVLPVPTAPSREYYRKWYAVRFVDGGTPGVYNTWQEAEAAISGRYAEHRSFDSQAEALSYAFGSSYGRQLLPTQQQHETQLQPVQEEEDIQAEVLSASHQMAANNFGFDSAAASHPMNSQSEQVDLPPEYDPYNEHSYFQYGADGDDAGAYGGDYETREISSWMSPPVPYGLPTGLRMPVLAAWDAATVRQPLPAQPNSGGGWSSSSSSLPLPASPAMTMPLSYDAPYASPAMPAMVLTAAAAVAPARVANRGLSRRRHHQHGSPGWVNFDGPPLQQPPCAASRSSSPITSVTNSDSFPAPAVAAAMPLSSSEPSLSSDGEAGPSTTAAAVSQQSEYGADDPDLNSPDPDSVRARDSRHSGDHQGSAEPAVAASRQEEYGSDRAATPVKGRRGRPRKAPVSEISPLPAGGNGSSSVVHMPPTKRPRGRPRKQHGTDASTVVVSEPEPAVNKRSRGRPRKVAAVKSEPTAGAETNSKVKRPRGRPRRGDAAAASAAPQPRAVRGRVGVVQPAESPTKAERKKKKIKAASLPPPSKAVGEEPVKSRRGRPRNPYPYTGLTRILTPGGWTPRAPGSLCLEPDHPYILAFHWTEEPHSTATTTSVPASSPHQTSTSTSGSNPGGRTNSSATPQSGSLELSYSVLLLDGEDYSLVANKAGSVRCQDPADGTYVLLNLCVQDVMRKSGLRRVLLLGTGLQPALCMMPSACSFSSSSSSSSSSVASVEGGATHRQLHQQQASQEGEESREGGFRSAETDVPRAEKAVAAGEAAVALDVECNLLHDEPTLSGTAKTLRSMSTWRRRVEGAKEFMELMPDGTERDALLSLAARAPELQLTVEQLVGEWAPRYDKCTLLSSILAVQSELYGLRREFIQNGLGVTAAAAAADATPHGASVTAAAKGGDKQQDQLGNAPDDPPHGAAADGSGLLLTLREVLCGLAACESSAHAQLLVRAFVLRKLHLDLITWLESPFERRRFLNAAVVKSSSFSS